MPKRNPEWRGQSPQGSTPWVGDKKEGADMRRTIVLMGVLPFVSAFLGGTLAYSLMAVSVTTAQSSQPQEVRASEFTLVGPDGTVLASLSQSRTGAGFLRLFDAEGKRRVLVSGTGTYEVYDGDETTLLFRAGRTFGGPNVLPPINGVELGPGGSISIIAPLR
jgi:hypothetical protein